MALVNGGFMHYTDMKKFLKNLLWNHWSDFEIISQECSLGDPFQKLFAKFWSIYKHGSGKWKLLALYRHEEILKKSSSPKPLRGWNNFFLLLAKNCECHDFQLAKCKLLLAKWKVWFCFILLSISLIYHKMKTSRSRFTEKLRYHFLHIIVIPWNELTVITINF